MFRQMFQRYKRGCNEQQSIHYIVFGLMDKIVRKNAVEIGMLRKVELDIIYI